LPSPTPSRSRINLPVELTSFVGRRDELALVRRRLGSARLVTLTGPGGVGKTRLALRAAREVARQAPDGVFFVALSEVRDPMLVTQSVVAALGLQDRSVAWSLPMLTEFLAGKRILLVLDNCEHLLDATAVMAGTLLRECPDLRVVATSRQALGVAGEVVEHVSPLSQPDAADASTADAMRSDAVSLFVERATAARPGFVLDARNLPAVLELCRRLDGVPLAIELAAVRLDSLGLDALVEGVRGRLDLLGSGDRSQEPRQRTLDATIDWSYQLLSEPERLLWARVSVFAGGFELDAAREVCADDLLPAESLPLLLAALVEKSIVKRAEQSGRERFRVLEILRQFGRERLREAGDERTLRLRHAEWVSGIASTVAADDGRLVDSMARLRAETSNLWVALDFCLEDERGVELGITICRDLYNFWLAEGHFSKVVGILAAFLDRVPETRRARAEALWVSAMIYATMADHAQADRLATEALAIGRAIGAADIVASALTGRASAFWVEGRWDEAIAEALEVMNLSRSMGLRFHELTAMNIETLGYLGKGDIAASIAAGYRALASSRELGELFLRGYILQFLAAATLRNGQPDEAERLAREGVEIRRDLGHVYGLGSLAEVLANIEATKGNDQRAATLLGGADAIWQSISYRHTVPNQREHDRVRSETRGRLGHARYDTAYAAGLAMDRSTVIEYALGGPIPAGRTKAKPAMRSSAALSTREMEVARLVADGASNAQTAAQLFIGERTVESHVASIFNKLGVDSRVQVARWVASLDDHPRI
jgi:predicted ATPase/DNA-binding CsgD family transcriptional regulator